MRLLTYLFILLSISLQPLPAQEIGEPMPVEIAENSTTLTLDFSKCDYELILYSIDTHLENGSFGLQSPLLYSVTAAFGASNPVVDGNEDAVPQAPLSDRVSFDSLLRVQERDLASRLQASGGYRPHAAKVASQQIGSTRQFVFPSFGEVSKTTITASLVATGERANAYVDVADVSRMNPDSLQAQVDRFSKTTYPIVTSAIGPPSDVDSDGKIHFLYTDLVNPNESIFGAAGFFHAPSLLSVSRGGNGNLSDMFYIDPDTDPGRVDAVLAHEFQHLINFNQRVLVRNGQPEVLWLNEGLSHFCENLVGENFFNESNAEFFLDFTGRGPLVTNGNCLGRSRGALYLFVHSLVEEFGSGIVSRLVQTDKTGIANIEAATGRRFGDIFDRHVSRLFLSGLGLNTKLNYTSAPLADDISHARAFPLPKQPVIWPGGGYQIYDGGGFDPVFRSDAHTVTITGLLHQLSPMYIRLTGNRKQTTITIQTDPDGTFRAQLIPIPVNFQPRIAIPSVYWPRATFDPPLPFRFRTGQAISIGGTSSAAAPSGVVDFVFENALREIRFRAPVTEGQFSTRVFFYPDEVGLYTLRIGVNRKFSTTYSGMAVLPGEPPSPDFDRDGTVEFADFILFARAFGKSWADEDFEPWFDLDLDGEVGFSDFLIFGEAFGTNGRQ